jgi:hypothetical protein
MATIRGTWYFNNILTGVTEYRTQGVACTTALGSWKGIVLSDTPTTLNFYKESAQQPEAYSFMHETWNKPQDRLVDFGAAPQEVSNEFYSWLTSNAQDVTLEGLRMFPPRPRSYVGSFSYIATDYYWYSGDIGPIQYIELSPSICYSTSKDSTNCIKVYDYTTSDWLLGEKYRIVNFGYTNDLTLTATARQSILSYTEPVNKKIYTEGYLEGIAAQIRNCLTTNPVMSITQISDYIHEVFENGKAIGAKKLNASAYSLKNTTWLLNRELDLDSLSGIFIAANGNNDGSSDTYTGLMVDINGTPCGDYCYLNYAGFRWGASDGAPYYDRWSGWLTDSGHFYDPVKLKIVGVFSLVDPDKLLAWLQANGTLVGVE